mmetsp:Transcript_113105/g.178773  ORF Transcript_113105/g.178773 Transcript_113105/m.178773 type:complete len:105 (-) Transcript_113105:19-333(-)
MIISSSPINGNLKMMGAPVQCHSLPCGSPVMLLSANKNIGQKTTKPCGCHVIMYRRDRSHSKPGPDSETIRTPSASEYLRSIRHTSTRNQIGPKVLPLLMAFFS